MPINVGGRRYRRHLRRPTQALPRYTTQGDGISMSRANVVIVELSTGPDHGAEWLGRAADTLLTSIGDPKETPQIAMVYNILPDPPGPASYALMVLDPLMWQLAPSLTDVFDLLTDLAGKMKGNPSTRDEALRYRPDGIAMVYRALTADSSTPAGSAIIANAADGHYRHGDVAASPAARTRAIANAVDRDGASIMLTTLPDGRVADMITALGMPADVTVNAGGAVDDGLSNLLTAMYGVYHDLLAPH